MFVRQVSVGSRNFFFTCVRSREAAFVYADLPFLDDPFSSRGVTPEVLTNLNSAEFQNAAKADPHFSAYPGVFRTAMQNSANKAKVGIRCGMGTDSGLGKRFPGHFAHWEPERMVQAGLTPLQSFMVDARRLPALGVGFMEQALEMEDRHHAATCTRDGLVIAVLTSCPMRTGNLTAIAIGSSSPRKRPRPRILARRNCLQRQRPADVDGQARRHRHRRGDETDIAA